jgi:N-acetylneuraminate synthase
MKTIFIAEVSSNHNADLPRCLDFVRTAASIGCDAVKFQLFRLENLFAPEILERSVAHRNRKTWELPVSFLPTIAETCRKCGIAFCCTPFDMQAVDELDPWVDIYKISSYELTWPALLHACGASGKPVILSTGMASLEECMQAVVTLRKSGCNDLTLLHCVSHYPAKPEEANLAAMDTIRDVCSCKVGWSDHTGNSGVICQAVFGFSAAVVEFHLDLEGNGVEFASGHCWLPEQMADVIRDVRAGEQALGDGVKRPTPHEEDERWWRADPVDGLRPFRHIRAKFRGDDCA